ncbi:MAG: hypothetical protein IJ058_01760, partial [Lachnospiraceae bacterium]|nr:hypothetical protein [Lachnospiraceae bacterium]
KDVIVPIYDKVNLSAAQLIILTDPCRMSCVNTIYIQGFFYLIHMPEKVPFVNMLIGYEG